MQPHGVPKALRTDTVIVMSDHRLQRAWQVLRREGLRSFWFKFLGVLGYRRLFLLSRSLTEPIPAVSASLPLTMNWLTPAELTEYLAFRSATGAEQIADRLKRNQRCLVARAQGRWVGAMWADTQRAWIEYLERELPLAPGEVYLFDAYTNPAFRGQAIAPAMSAELLRRFRDEGCPRALRGTLPENLAALRAHAKAGFQTYALMGRIKIGPWRHDFLTVRASRAQIT